MRSTDRDPVADRGSDAGHANEVLLRGRLAADPVRRDLPSGDTLVSFRLVVDRLPPPRRPRRSPRAPGAPGSRAPTVDTLDCAAWRKDVQRSLSRAAPGDVLEVHGSLRRRFWKTGTGAASRSEVEVARVRRLSAAQ